jgi:regulator of replication initiation timing
MIKNMIMAKEFTKSDLEQIIGLQQESLQALQKIVGRLRHQNERLERTNQKLRKRVSKYE